MSAAVYTRQAAQRRVVRQSTEALRKSEERFQLIARASNDVIWDWNIEAGACWVSHGIRHFGYTESVPPGGRPWLDHIPPDHRSRVLRGLEKVLASQEQNWSEEYPFLRQDGALAHVFNRASVIRNAQGRPVRMVGAMMDVTQRKLAEQLGLEHRQAQEKIRQQEEERKGLEAQFLRAQRLEGLGALASGIAHDLNNVLLPIFIGVPLLKEQAWDHSIRKILSAMETSAAHGADLVRQVLSFARGATGERLPLQPNQLISEMAWIIRETFPKTIEISTQCDPKLWEIEGNGTQIHQVLLNLCVNARDAMPKSGRLMLSSKNVQLRHPVSEAGLSGAPGKYVRITVADTGMGMTSEVRKKIFQPFFTTKDPGKGTGLGLSTTVRILQNHGGLISLESQPGCGASFSVYIPAKAAAPPAVVVAAPPLPLGKHELVLLVVHELGLREMCRLILESFDYRVVMAKNSADALALLARHKDEVSAAIVDVTMLVMDGTAAIRAMRQCAPGLKIIATSGSSEKEQAAAMGKAVPDAIVQKPYTAGQLVSVLAGVLAPARPGPAPAG
jgi:PAS domain S-box-containing protein